MVRVIAGRQVDAWMDVAGFVELTDTLGQATRQPADSATVAVFNVPAGRYEVLVRAIGYARAHTHLLVRAGYRDTVTARVERAALCLKDVTIGVGRAGG